MCVCVYKCHHMNVKVRGQVYEVISHLLFLPGSWGLNWAHQPCMASAFTHWAIPPTSLTANLEDKNPVYPQG